ncbi:hypothetical protein [Geoglobus acetivorans]
MNENIKRILTASLIIISVLSAGIAAYAYTIQPENVEEKTVQISAMKGKLTHSAILSNQSIYGNEVSREYYPAEMTESFLGNYIFTTTTEKTGSYVFTIDTSYYIQDGKNRIEMWNETKFYQSGEYKNSASINFTINPSELRSDLERVKEGTGVSRMQQDVRINFRASDENGVFQHSVSLVKKSELYRFSDTEKTEQITENIRNVKQNYLTGMEIQDARVIYATLTFSALIPAAILNRDYFQRIRAKRMESNAYMVSGRKTGNKVIVDSLEDLKKVFQLTDSPILKAEEKNETVYSIEANGLTYEFRN